MCVSLFIYVSKTILKSFNFFKEKGKFDNYWFYKDFNRPRCFFIDNCIILLGHTLEFGEREGYFQNFGILS